MNRISQLYQELIDSFGVAEPKLTVAYVKLYRKEETIPSQVSEFFTEADEGPSSPAESVMSCQAARHAAAGNPVLLTINNVGCVAAAISLGLVDQYQDTPLAGRRVYTCIMRDQAHLDESHFTPPSPLDFSRGTVYACASANRRDFCLFGEEDTGRFKDEETARRALTGMMAIQPDVMQGVFFYSNDFDALDLEPDIVLLSARPVELTKLIQGYSWLTGRRINASMGAVRAVNSDLIARPYLTGEINVSPYCLGSRLVAGFEANYMGLGIPMKRFTEMVEGCRRAAGGYPFQQYPGAQS